MILVSLSVIKLCLFKLFSQHCSFVCDFENHFRRQIVHRRHEPPHHATQPAEVFAK